MMSYNTNAKVGVIVPVYNTEKYIARCIESILVQTYKNFHLILIDDASPDNAGDICDKYAKTDNRITVVHQDNLGVTRARANGVALASDCEHITFVDSDDTLTPDALALLISRMTADTDIVLSYRVANLPVYRPIKRLQIRIEDYRTKLLNRKVSSAPWGKLFRRRLFNDYVFDIPREITVGEDLLMNIRLAYNTNKHLNVIHHDIYNYSIYNESTVNRFSANPRFEALWHKLIIASIPDKKEQELYAKNSISFRICRYRNLGGFNCYDNSLLSQTDFYKELKDDIKKYCYFLSLKKSILFHSTNPALRRLVIDPKHRFSNFKKYVRSLPFFAWRKVLKRCKRYRNSKERLDEGYSFNTPIKSNAEKRVVCIYDNKLRMGGLADRLRGILSVYYICKQQDIAFKILFNHPFELNRYLIPNNVNWGITEDALNYNLRETDLCMITSTVGGIYEREQQEKWFKKEFHRDFQEFHVRTNAPFSFRYNFSELFHELFRPSELLESLIDKHKDIVGENYISVSFRFLDLLGDFNETFGQGTLSSEEERKRLIDQCKKQLELLHNKYPYQKILVNSDSITFLKSASTLGYTYVIPGEISHVDNPTPVEINVHDKTFTDFFMIANAQNIYLVIADKMYSSNFPYVASRLYNRPFYRIHC